MKTMPHKSWARLALLATTLILALALWELGYSVWVARQAPPAASPFLSIDLTKLRWYARPGFSEQDRGGFSADARGVREIHQLPIPAKAVFEIPSRTTVQKFALMTSFDLGPESTAPAQGLSLAEIRDNWVAYLNGIELRRDTFLGAGEQMLLHRSVFGLFIPLPRAAIRPGPHSLVFRIVGATPVTPLFASWLPGSSTSQGYTIAPIPDLVRKKAAQDSVSCFRFGGG